MIAELGTYKVQDGAFSVSLVNGQLTWDGIGCAG